MLLTSIDPPESILIIGVVVFFFKTSKVKFEILPSALTNSSVANDHSSILFRSSFLKF